MGGQEGVDHALAANTWMNDEGVESERSESDVSGDDFLVGSLDNRHGV